MPGALPAVTVPSVASPRSTPSGRAKTGRSLASASGARVAAWVLVGFDDGLATLRVGDRDRRHLGVEATGIDRRDRLLVAGERERVLVGAADLVLDRDTLGVGAHVAVLDGAPEPIGDGGVDQLGVAEAEPEARAWKEVWRAVHRLHATGDDDFGVTRLDLRGGEHDRLQTRATDAVDRGRARPVGQAGLEQCLTRRGLARAGLEDLAHEHVVDLRCVPDRGRRARRPP